MVAFFKLKGTYRRHAEGEKGQETVVHAERFMNPTGAV